MRRGAPHPVRFAARRGADRAIQAARAFARDDRVPDADAMRQVALRCGQALAEGGTLVACDWQPGFTQRALPTREVHAARYPSVV